MSRNNTDNVTHAPILEDQYCITIASDSLSEQYISFLTCFVLYMQVLTLFKTVYHLCSAFQKSK